MEDAKAVQVVSLVKKRKVCSRQEKESGRDGVPTPPLALGLDKPVFHPTMYDSIKL